MSGEARVFHEDRSDVFRRAMPRLAVGLGVTLLLVVAVVKILHPEMSLRDAMVVIACVWPATLLLRGDVFALQWGRRIRYEVTRDTFTAFRGGKVVVRFDLGEVEEWVAASSASTMEYWLGWGLWRSAALPVALPQYRFTLRADVGARPRSVTPPALFRWRDRGGLGDVTDTLVLRLGPPLNYSIDHRVEEE